MNRSVSCLFFVGCLFLASVVHGAGSFSTISSDGTAVRFKPAVAGPAMVFLPAPPAPPSSPFSTQPGLNAFHAVFDTTAGWQLARLNLKPTEAQALLAGTATSLELTPAGADLPGRLSSPVLANAFDTAVAVAPDPRPLVALGGISYPHGELTSAQWLAVKDQAATTIFLVSTALTPAQLLLTFPYRWVYQAPSGATDSVPLKAEAVWDEAVLGGASLQHAIRLTFNAPLSDKTLRGLDPRSAAAWFGLAKGKIVAVDSQKRNVLRLFLDTRGTETAKQFVKPTPRGQADVVGSSGETMATDLVIVVPKRGEGTLKFEQSATFGGGGYSFPTVNAKYKYQLHGTPLFHVDADGNVIRDGEKGYELGFTLDVPSKPKFLGKTSLQLHKYRLAHTEARNIRQGFDFGLEGDGGADTLNTIANYSYSLIGGERMLLTHLFGNGYEEARLCGTLGYNLNQQSLQFRGERDEFARVGLLYRFVQRVHALGKPANKQAAIDIGTDFQYLVEDNFVACFLDAHLMKAINDEVSLDLRYATGRQAPNFVDQNVVTAGVNVKL